MAKVLFGLALAPAAVSFLDAMPAGKLRARITKKAKALIHDPRPSGCKKLKVMSNGADPVYRVRVGDYRILYVIREIEVIVLDIGHRKDIYK